MGGGCEQQDQPQIECVDLIAVYSADEHRRVDRHRSLRARHLGDGGQQDRMAVCVCVDLYVRVSRSLGDESRSSS